MSSYRWGPPPSPYRGGGGSDSYNILGLFVPKVVVWLLGLTLGTSAIGALLQRNDVFPAITYGVLDPTHVLRGELWRLVSWMFFEYGMDGLSLIFGCAFLFMLGRDLAPLWGTKRFLILYVATGVSAAVVTCLVALVWPEVRRTPYLSMWPVLDALVIAWAVYNPGARLLIWFVLPVSGRNIIWVTIAITFLFAVMYGFALFVPHFAAELLALVYLDVLSVRRLYLRSRMAMLQRDYKKRTGNLRAVERDRDEPPRWTH